MLERSAGENGTVVLPVLPVPLLTTLLFSGGEYGGGASTAGRRRVGRVVVNGLLMSRVSLAKVMGETTLAGAVEFEEVLLWWLLFWDFLELKRRNTLSMTG